MELMDTGLIDIIKAGDMFVLSAPSGGFYCAEKVSKKSTIWNYHVQSETAAVHAKTVVEVLKSECGGFIGFRSHHAEGNTMQKARFFKHAKTRICSFDLTTTILTRHFCYQIMQWEHWIIYGSSLNKTLLVNRKFPDKYFEASFEKVLITTEGALHAFLKNLSDEHAETLKEAPGACQDENSSHLHNVIDQAVLAMIQQARHQWTERRALESENMLKAACKKAQDLEVQVVQIQQSSALDRKEADEKLVFLLRELDNARLVAEGATTDKSKLKLVEEEYKQVKDELYTSKSLLQNKEMTEKMARDEAEKLTLQCDRMGREVNEVKALLIDAKEKLKAKEEELLLKMKILEDEVRTLRKKEENQNEALRTMEKELKSTMKRAADFESELKGASNKRKEDFRQAKLEEFSNHSLGRFAKQQQKSSSSFNDNNERSTFAKSMLSDANDVCTGSKHSDEHLGLKMINLKNAQSTACKGSIDLDAQIVSAESVIEWQKIQGTERHAHSQIEITELLEKLRKSEIEISSHKELLSHVHKEVHAVQLSRDHLMEKLKKVEREAEADLLRIKVSLEESMFSQKCEELIAAVMVLSNKVFRLESFFQTIQAGIKSNSEACTLSISALNIDLLCSKELIENLEDSLKKTEMENDAARSQIEGITTRFSDLNDQLKHEIKRLEMQIAALMQENKDLNAMVLLLQHKLQESSHVAKLQERKLKEGRSRRTELQKKVHHLKAHLKEMRARESTSIEHLEGLEKTQETDHHALRNSMAHHGSQTSCTHSCFATFFAISFVGFLWILWQR